jgi:hypothetical protein
MIAWCRACLYAFFAVHFVPHFLDHVIEPLRAVIFYFNQPGMIFTIRAAGFYFMPTAFIGACSHLVSSPKKLKPTVSWGFA